MSASNKGAGVHRLLDMIVEEVSLVDRAANKQRFLIVKRSDHMNNATAQTLTSGNVDAADAPAVNDVNDASEEVEDLNSESQTEDTQVETDSNHSLNSDNASLQQLAVSALTGLTEAVELIGNAEDADAQSKLGELATELQGLANELAGKFVPQTAAPKQTDVPAVDVDALSESIKRGLARIDALLAPVKDKTDDATNGMEAQLKPMLDEIRNLTAMVKAQQQRLVKLEKRFGVPSSVPVGEKKSEPDDVGWPLDMNRSCDRESVDKAVSFHDL